MAQCSELYVSGDTNLDSKLIVGSDVSLNAGLYVAGSTVLDGAADFSSTLLVSGDASFNNELYVAGTTTIGGAVLSCHLW